MIPSNCKRCGYCCTLRVRLSQLDILRITRLGHKKKDFIEKDARGKPCIKIINNDCYFLKRKNKKTSCTIYNARPKVCRQYPSELQLKECSAYKDLIL